MSPFITKILGAVLGGFTKKNLNPANSKTTGIAYAGAGSLAYLLDSPPGTDYDAWIQLAVALVSIVFFYIKPKVGVKDE